MLQENAKLFSTISVTFCISTSEAWVFLYSLFLPELGVVSLLAHLFRYLNRCVAFNLQYPNHKWCWTFFLVLICHLYILFEVSLQILYPFFNWIICFLTDVFGVFLCILDTDLLPDRWHENIFSKIVAFFSLLLTVFWGTDVLHFGEVQFVLFFNECVFGVISKKLLSMPKIFLHASCHKFLSLKILGFIFNKLMWLYIKSWNQILWVISICSFVSEIFWLF